MAVVGFDTPTIEKSLQLSHDYPNIYSIIGWHPTEAGSYTKEIENKLQEQLTLPKVVALGKLAWIIIGWKTRKKSKIKYFADRLLSQRNEPTNQYSY